jgi:hypothetical protein
MIALHNLLLQDGGNKLSITYLLYSLHTSYVSQSVLLFRKLRVKNYRALETNDHTSAPFKHYTPLTTTEHTALTTVILKQNRKELVAQHNNAETKVHDDSNLCASLDFGFRCPMQVSLPVSVKPSLQSLMLGTDINGGFTASQAFV